MTLAREYKALALSASLVVFVFAATLTYQFSSLSGEGARLLGNLQRTAQLGQELAIGNAEQTIRLQQQFERLEPGFGDELRALTFSLGDHYTEYLKLDIGEDERLVVERIKALQSESSLLAMQIHQHLRAGHAAEADRLVHHLHDLHGGIRNHFDDLQKLQVRKIGDVVGHLASSSERGLRALYALLGLLALFTMMSVLLLRSRVLKPVQALLESSSRIRQGDFEARAPVRRQDEIGQLAQGFNFMAESLAASYSDLERKVEERAAQLQAMQQQLVRADKMSAVGLLVSGVAHELNNPLAAVRGFAELTRMELQAGGHAASGRSVALLEEMDAQIERCRKIVVNLLQFARQQEPRLEMVDLNALVDAVLSLREYELAALNITLVRDLAPAIPGVFADGDRIRQVLLNLLNNAHDAIRDAGRPGTIRVSTHATATHVTIVFDDDGPGFADAQRAFDPFYTTKEVGKGTGLGLSVCYGIIAEHDGEIRAANSGSGARVTVALPIGDGDRAAAPRREPAAAAAEAQPLHAPSRVTRALVVDDEAMMLRLQKAFLAKMGIEAAAVSSGAAAIAYLEAHDVDVIVSDVRMPGEVDGVGLFAWIETNRPLLVERFVFASGDLVGMNLGEFFQRSPVARVEKPFRFADYSRAIREAVQRGRQQ